MSDPTFILSSAPSALPPSAPLNLLPFSLGPSSNPYTSGTVPISTYFVPRPSPAGNSGVPTGQPLASFRGRQVVGQTVSVPRGYRGVVISASRRPELGLEHRDGVKGKGKGKAVDGKWPLTPAPSAASVSGASSIAADEDGSNGVRRSPRKSAGPVRGAGQVALSRPKTRQIQSAKRGVAKRRFRLDSDDEDEDGEDEQHDVDVDGARPGPESRQQVQSDENTPPSNTPLRTPSKRSRPNPSSTVGTPKSVVASPSLPSIVIQEPTPRKEPLPPSLRSLRKDKDSRKAGAGGVPPVLHEGDEQWVEDVHVQNDGTAVPQSDQNEVKEELDDERVAGEERSAVGGVESTIIPSPATENDPPAFDIEDKPTVSANNDNTRDTVPPEQGAGEGDSLDVSGPVRLLRPVAGFDSFTLWTPDAPLAGFRAGESDQPKDEATGAGSKPDETEGTEGGIKVRPGWWRMGGAGEGGDEVVRAMGEWLGLVEMLNEPVYLAGLEDDDDE